MYTLFYVPCPFFISWAKMDPEKISTNKQSKS